MCNIWSKIEHRRHVDDFVRKRIAIGTVHGVKIRVFHSKLQQFHAAAILSEFINFRKAFRQHDVHSVPILYELIANMHELVDMAWVHKWSQQDLCAGAWSNQNRADRDCQISDDVYSWREFHASALTSRHDWINRWRLSLLNAKRYLLKWSTCEQKRCQLAKRLVESQRERWRCDVDGETMSVN